MNQKFFSTTCKTPFNMIYYICPPARGRGFRPSRCAYHHLIAVIKAAIATIALITKSAISNVVGLFFRFFILSPPLLSILYHTASSMSIPFFNIFYFFKKITTTTDGGCSGFNLFQCLTANRRTPKEHQLISSIHNRQQNASLFQFLKRCHAQ